MVAALRAPGFPSSGFATFQTAPARTGATLPRSFAAIAATVGLRGRGMSFLVLVRHLGATQIVRTNTLPGGFCPAHAPGLKAYLKSPGRLVDTNERLALAVLAGRLHLLFYRLGTV